MSGTFPLLTPDIIVTTFANAGNVTQPPQTDPNGFVNYQDGYGPDYEIDLDSGNTAAKGVERSDQNYLFGQGTVHAQWWQSMGLAPWYSAMENQGVAGYNAGALVGRVNATSGEWIIWRSLADANTVDPNTSGQTSWDYVPTDADLSTMFAMPAGGQGQKLLPGGITTEQILAATNFNSLVTGTFEYVTDAIAAGSANTPSNYAGMVECKLWSNTAGGVTTTFGVQRYLDRTGTIWVRGMRNGAWTAWATFAITYASVIAALGFVPANSATTVNAGTGLSGGGPLTGNVTLSLGATAAGTVLANPTAGSATPVGCTLLNGIILNSPANTLGLGTITPVNVASQGYVSGTTGTFSGSVSCAGLSSSGPVSGTTATFSGITSNGQEIINYAGAGGLTLQGNTTAASTSIVLTNGATGGRSWEMGSAGGTTLTAGWFYIRDVTGAGNRLTIDTAGNVTIPNGSISATVTGSTPAGVFTTTGSPYGVKITDTTGTSGIGLYAGNGSTTPNKFIRSNGSTGNLEFLNSAYSAVVASMSDTGQFNMTGIALNNTTGGNFGQLTNTGTTYLWGSGGSGDNIMSIARNGSGSYAQNWYGTINLVSDIRVKSAFKKEKPRTAHHAFYGSYRRKGSVVREWGLKAQGEDGIQACMPWHVHEDPKHLIGGSPILAVDYIGVALEQSFYNAFRADDQDEEIAALKAENKAMRKELNAIKRKLGL
jgi:hypothetical protein